MNTKDKFKDLVDAESALNVANDARENSRIVYDAAWDVLVADRAAYDFAYDVVETARAAYDASDYADRCADYITKETDENV